MSVTASDSDSELPQPLDEQPQSSDIDRVQLFGVPLASLRLHGEERLCLAQISATLLSRHTYNEIHNRRVALGITCVQCTPGQLDSLRRVGAMPAAAKRCGTITVREAERLVRSFHGESARPSLPAGYSFVVSHACGWGCRGSFFPDRYTSSRARCVMCAECRQFFSPNKFIFHSHQADSGGGFRQPDAANFNAWRRHLTLAEPAPSSEVQHNWEDVKALYNGGSRMGGGGDEGGDGGRSCAVEFEKPSQGEKQRRPRTDSGDSSCTSYFNSAGGDVRILGDGDIGRGGDSDVGAGAGDSGSGCAEQEKLAAAWPLLWAKCLLLSACNPWDGQCLAPQTAVPALWGGQPQALQALHSLLPQLPPQPELVAVASAAAAAAAATAAGTAAVESASSAVASDGSCGGRRGLKRRRCDYSIEAIMSSNP